MNAVRELVSSNPNPSDDDIAACKVDGEDFQKALDKFGPKVREELKEYGRE